MKFLTISSVKDAASTIPLSVIRPLLEATHEQMKQQKKAGKFLEAYALAGCNRYMVISEANSAEEIAQTIITMPVGGFMNFETYPLADFDETMTAIIENMKAMEKMMPGPPG